MALARKIVLFTAGWGLLHAACGPPCGGYDVSVEAVDEAGERELFFDLDLVENGAAEGRILLGTGEYVVVVGQFVQSIAVQSALQLAATTDEGPFDLCTCETFVMLAIIWDEAKVGGEAWLECPQQGTECDAESGTQTESFSITGEIVCGSFDWGDE